MQSQDHAAWHSAPCIEHTDPGARRRDLDGSALPWVGSATVGLNSKERRTLFAGSFGAARQAAAAISQCAGATQLAGSGAGRSAHARHCICNAWRMGSACVRGRPGEWRFEVGLTRSALRALAIGPAGTHRRLGARSASRWLPPRAWRAEVDRPHAGGDQREERDVVVNFWSGQGIDRSIVGRVDRRRIDRGVGRGIGRGILTGVDRRGVGCGVGARRGVGAGGICWQSCVRACARQIGRCAIPVAVHIRGAAVAVRTGAARSAQEPARRARDLVARRDDCTGQSERETERGTEGGTEGDAQGPKSSRHPQTIS